MGKHAGGQREPRPPQNITGYQSYGSQNKRNGRVRELAMARGHVRFFSHPAVTEADCPDSMRRSFTLTTHTFVSCLLESQVIPEWSVAGTLHLNLGVGFHCVPCLFHDGLNCNNVMMASHCHAMPYQFHGMPSHCHAMPCHPTAMPCHPTATPRHPLAPQENKRNTDLHFAYTW